MKRLQLLTTLASLALAGWALPSLAVETTVNYAMPTEYCDGRAIAEGDIDQMEIYISAAPIPASDVPCAGTSTEVDQPPETFSTRIEADATQTQAVVDLFPGQYFARARVASSGEWSNFSNEVTIDVPGPLRPPVILDIRF